MAMKAIADGIAGLHRYPDPGCHELAQKLSQKWGVKPSQLAFGNGSNEIIDLLIRVYCQPGDKILTSQAAFIAYKICAQAAGVQTIETPMTSDYKVDLNAMSDYLKTETQTAPRLVFFPNPNNPTGTYVVRTEVEAFLKEHGNRDDLLIVFDEAYHEFVRAEDYQSGLNYLEQYKNVVVMRTFSKVYGLAGLRVGALVGPESVMNYYHRVRNPFNVNHLAQVAAAAAVDDTEFLKRAQEVTWSGLDYFYKELDKLGLSYAPSEANFVLVDLKRPVEPINEALLKRGVIARPVQPYGLRQHLRLSVGLAEENQAAIKALREVLAELPENEG